MSTILERIAAIEAEVSVFDSSSGLSIKTDCDVNFYPFRWPERRRTKRLLDI